MGNVHKSLSKSLNQRKLLIIWCTRFLKIPDRIESAALKSRHAMTSLFRFPRRKFESQCIMYCSWTLGCQNIHLQSCSTRSMLNGLLLQHNPNCNPDWIACVVCQYYFGVDIAYFLQEGEWNWCYINTFKVPFDLTACTPFTWVHSPDAERKNPNKEMTSQGDMRAVTVVMQSVGGFLDKYLHAQIIDCPA